MQVVVETAQRWGIPPDRFLCVARRESGLDPSVIGPGPFYGLYQFSPRTGPWAFAAVGYDFWSSWDDPVANAEAAGWLWTHDRPSRQWPSTFRRC